MYTEKDFSCGTFLHTDDTSRKIIIREYVTAATTENIDIKSISAGSIIDNCCLRNDDRLLVKDQKDEIENGIYTVTLDNIENNEFVDCETQDFYGSYYNVENGEKNGGSAWIIDSHGYFKQDKVVFVCDKKNISFFYNTNHFAKDFENVSEITAPVDPTFNCSENAKFSKDVSITGNLFVQDVFVKGQYNVCADNCSKPLEQRITILENQLKKLLDKNENHDTESEDSETYDKPSSNWFWFR